VVALQGRCCSVNAFQSVIPAQARGIKSTCKRHGTVNLFAALGVATGVIRGKTTQTKKRADFQVFMDDIVAEQPENRQIHVILDNLNTHKKLAAHPMQFRRSNLQHCPAPRG